VEAKHSSEGEGEDSRGGRKRIQCERRENPWSQKAPSAIVTKKIQKESFLVVPNTLSIVERKDI